MQLEDLIRRMGESIMKGGTPTSLRTQALAILQIFLKENSTDAWGYLNQILIRWVEQNSNFSKNFSNPLALLKETIQNILNRNEILFEFVREVDMQYSQSIQEKPIFQKPGEAPNPNDEYTIESVQKCLHLLVSKL